MLKALILPGKQEAKAIVPLLPIAVYLFWNMCSPENARPNILPIPPLDDVSIFILGDIHDIAPFSVIIVSPGSRTQVTTGSGSPSIV